MNSKKILVGTITLGMTIAALQSCKDNKESKTETMQSTEKMADAKCGEGKCGDSAKVSDAKCGEKKGDSSMVKLKEGKCGDSKK
ncbi:HvfA family oxazolone/thioamide-modified RiPP metallophore [Chryseobacterium terrae]|uniref:DUF2282 domain-containing protein n=1 Tax=Chryseobacterium terrae TaxID=3163299 RepID=A0ABW8Y0E2_9FLAO